MLLSAIYSNIVSFDAIPPGTSPTSPIFIFTRVGLPQYGPAMAVALITLLCLKEVLQSYQKWNKYQNNSLNLVIIPFFLCLIATLIFTISKIMGFF
jgi:hypothetical protein